MSRTEFSRKKLIKHSSSTSLVSTENNESNSDLIRNILQDFKLNKITLKQATQKLNQLTTISNIIINNYATTNINNIPKGTCEKFTPVIHISQRQKIPQDGPTENLGTINYTGNTNSYSFNEMQISNTYDTSDKNQNKSHKIQISNEIIRKNDHDDDNIQMTTRLVDNYRPKRQSEIPTYTANKNLRYSPYPQNTNYKKSKIIIKNDGDVNFDEFYNERNSMDIDISTNNKCNVPVILEKSLSKNKGTRVTTDNNIELHEPDIDIEESEEENTDTEDENDENEIEDNNIAFYNSLSRQEIIFITKQFFKEMLKKSRCPPSLREMSWKCIDGIERMELETNLWDY